MNKERKLESGAVVYLAENQRLNLLTVDKYVKYDGKTKTFGGWHFHLSEGDVTISHEIPDEIMTILKEEYNVINILKE